MGRRIASVVPVKLHIHPVPASMIRANHAEHGRGGMRVVDMCEGVNLNHGRDDDVRSATHLWFREAISGRPAGPKKSKCKPTHRLASNRQRSAASMS